MQRDRAWRAGLIYMGIGVLLAVVGLFMRACGEAFGSAVTFSGVGFAIGALLVMVAAGGRLRRPSDHESATR